MEDIMQARNLDGPRLEALANKISTDIIAHYGSNAPPSIEHVCEALNALAVVTADVLAATSNDPKAMQFFLQALHTNLNIPVFTEAPPPGSMMQ